MGTRSSVLELGRERIRRYARHILLPDVGGVGQKRLFAAVVAVETGPERADEVAALAYLAAAGVGRLVLVGDARGAVTEREAARGILYGMDDVGRPRVDALAGRIAELNDDVTVVAGSAGHAVPLAELDDGHVLAAWLGCDHPDEDVAATLVRGGLRAVQTLTRLLAPQPERAVHS